MESKQFNDDPLVTANVCAVAQGLPKATFYRMVREGRIPSYRIGAKGRGLRFSIAEVRKALRNGGAASRQES